MSRDDLPPPPPFGGFHAAAFTFFEGLAEHQDKAWLAENKAVYENAVRVPMAALIAELTERLGSDGPPLRGDPWRSQFRLNRDVRFSKDKRPYKTNASATLTRSGTKMAPGVLYLQIGPEACFAAAGFVRPEPGVLGALRRGLVDDADGWREAVSGLAEARLSIESKNTLVRPPKGFADAPPELETALKLKSWIVRRPLAKALLARRDLVDALAEFATGAAPLLAFGWSALVRHLPAVSSGAGSR